MEMESFIEIHPYNDREIIPPDTETLIIGTAPPPRFSNPVCGGERDLDVAFFYGSEENYLWGEIFNSIAKDIEANQLFTDEDTKQDCIGKMRGFLKRHKLWMRDILQTYQRKDSYSAADNKISPIEFTDFSTALKGATCLSAIAFTSEQAAKWTFKAFIEQGLIKKEWFDVFSKRRRLKEDAALEKYKQPYFVIGIEQRAIRFYLLPTPTGRSRVGLRISDKVNIYKSVLFRAE
jgi:G:T/U-mismatch repair DNA glycosylase